MAKASKKKSEYYRETPLMQAIDDGRLEVAKVLLEAGHESVNKAGVSGGTPLQVAITRHNICAILLLFKFGVDVNASYPEKPYGKNHISPLFHALQGKQPVVASLLIEKNVLITEKDKHGQAPLHLAIKLQSLKVIHQLLERNHICINAKDNENKTPLMLSAEKGDVFTLEKLLIKGASADEQDSTGKIAMMVSAKRGDFCILRTLLQNSASVDIQNSIRETALMLAAFKSSTRSVSALYLPCIKLLIEASANVNLLDNHNNNALITACKHGLTDEDVVTSLLEAGTNVNQTDGKNDTALHHLIYACDAEIASILIDYGADVNCKSGECDTLLEILALDP